MQEKSLIDFFLCIPKLLESVLKKQHFKKLFVETCMIDSATGYVPVFDKLMGTCKRWISTNKDLSILKCKKQHYRSQFQSLMKIELKEGQVTYADMKAAGICTSRCVFFSEL